MAQAHALVDRADLPVPPWLFAWAASIVLIVSFFALSAGWSSPRLQREDWRPIAPRLSALLLNPVTKAAAGAVGVFLLALVLWSGFAGTVEPNLNFSVTFVFVTFWLGVALLSALFGNVFKAVNPWRALARLCGGAFRMATAHPWVPPLRYPRRLGRWPAAAGLVAFVWLEVVDAAGGSLSPRSVAVAASIYTTMTLVAMALFGVEAWLGGGETFSAYYEMFAELSVFEIKDGKLGRRVPLSGTAAWAQVPGSLALVLASLGGTTFDGAQEGAFKGLIEDVYNWFTHLGFGPDAALHLANTVLFAFTLALVSGLYLAGVRGMASIRTGVPLERLRSGFAHTLIPIALGYLIAHYFSLLVFQEQAQFTYLLSDPLGNGANWFGTVVSSINFNAVSPRTVWYVQVAALIVGHVTGLALAHDRAISVFGDSKIAARSQQWMLAVMVGFTSFGLFLLSQANR